MLCFNNLKIIQVLFETNLINLSIVLSIGLFFLYSKLQFFFTNRRKNIISNFFEVEAYINNELSYLLWALDEKRNALNNLLIIKIKTSSIIEKKKQFFEKNFIEQYMQLNKKENNFFYVKKQQSKYCFFTNLRNLLLKQIKQKLTKNLKPSIQKKINHYKIINFINSKNKI